MKIKTHYCSNCGKPSDRGCIQKCRQCSGLSGRKLTKRRIVSLASKAVDAVDEFVEAANTMFRRGTRVSFDYKGMRLTGIVSLIDSEAPGCVYVSEDKPGTPPHRVWIGDLEVSK